MTEILCKWLNKDLRLSKKITPDNFASEFSSGLLIGEIFSKYELQNDFDQFSQHRTAGAQLNNFTRLEPIMLLLGISFDTNTVTAIMNEKPGQVTRLLYEMFIALENKKKSNLTGVAMETMAPSAQTKLNEMSYLIYKERIKHLTPRQTDVNLKEIVERFHKRQELMEDKAQKLRIASAELHKREQEEFMTKLKERKRYVQMKQSEIMAKILATEVHIPKSPPNKTAAAIEARKNASLAREYMNAMADLDSFENGLQTRVISGDKEDYSLPSINQNSDNRQVSTKSSIMNPTLYIKPSSNIAYIAKIRQQLEESEHARDEREKRRRRVLVDCLKAHASQEDDHVNQLIAKRMMRQSQAERKIAVQLLQLRHEKEVVKQNRLFREQQYQTLSTREFQAAMDRERLLIQAAKHDYEEQLKLEADLNQRLVMERRAVQYVKHYEACADVVQLIVDFACNVAEYRNYTNNKIPYKFYREWVTLFVQGQPLIHTSSDDVKIRDNDVTDNNQQVMTTLLNDESEAVLDDHEFQDYFDLKGDWTPVNELKDTIKIHNNKVLEHIADRLQILVQPPKDTSSNQFPECPYRVAILGKPFSGKSTVINKLLAAGNCQSLSAANLVGEAMAAFEDNECEIVLERIETPLPPVTVIEDITQDVTQLGSASNMEAAVINSVSTEQIISDGNDVVAGNSGDVVEQKTTSTMQEVVKLTSRAQLGQRIVDVVKVGKPLDDFLLVEVVVDAIRRIPNGMGWFLDGFPCTLEQAILLEKHLTGKIEEQPAKVMPTFIHTSDTAAPETMGTDSACSGLDMVLYLDLDDNLSIKRSLGRVEDSISGDQYHYELNPPPIFTQPGLSITDSLRSVTDKSYDSDQLQHRLRKFAETWPEMQQFYSCDKQISSVLKVINVNHNIDDVVREAERLLADMLEEKRIRSLPPVLQLNLDIDTVIAPVLEPETANVISAQSEESIAPQQLSSSRVNSASNKNKNKKGGSKSSSRAGSAEKKQAALTKGKTRSRTPSADKNKKDVKKTSPGSRGSSADKAPAAGRKKSKSPVKSPTSPGRKSRPGTASKKQAAAGPAQTDVPAAEEEAPPKPDPESSNWIFVEEKLAIPMIKALLIFWDHINQSYAVNVKSSFRKVRAERDLIVKYFYEIRTSFCDYLKRCDTKQEFLAVFQKDFNEISPDLRNDEEVMQDLHKRIDDLRDKLFDISDERKASAEKKRDGIMQSVWLKDQVALLINNYFMLMQAEMDRFQDVKRMLKDYYQSMSSPMPDEMKADFIRLPMLTVPRETVEEDGDVQSSEGGSVSAAIDGTQIGVTPVVKASVSPVAKKGGKKDQMDNQTRILTDAEIEEMFKTRIPMLSSHPSLNDIATFVHAVKLGKDKSKGAVTGKDKKGDKDVEVLQPPNDQDERIVFDVFTALCQTIQIVLSNEQSIVDAEEEADNLKLGDKDKPVGKTDKAAAGKADKGKKGNSPAPKKGNSPAPKKGGKGGKAAEDSTAILPTESEESPEDKQKRETKEKIRKEYISALEKEGKAVCDRINLIRMVACQCLEELKKGADELFKDMLDWVGRRMLLENDAIEALTLMLRYAVENKTAIPEVMEIEAADFFKNVEFLMVEPVRPLSRTKSFEHVESDQFRMEQIISIFNGLKRIAPLGYISTTEFTNFFQDLVSQNQSQPDGLPDIWKNCSGGQLNDLVDTLSQDGEYINWRAFILALCEPWPHPTQTQLLQVLAEFRHLDQLQTGRIFYEQYCAAHLWFGEVVESARLAMRLTEIKKLFFDIFVDDKSEKNAVQINYEDMLLHFCASSNPYVGLLRALSLTNANQIPHVPIPNYENETHINTKLDFVIDDNQGALVSLNSLYKVLTFGYYGNKARTAVGIAESNLEDIEAKELHLSQESLAKIFYELGSEDLQPLPFTTLTRHAAFVELILQCCKQFKQIDINSFLADPSGDNAVATDVNANTASDSANVAHNTDD